MREKNRVEKAGESMQRFGKILTLAITLPFVGWLLFGIVGLVVGVLIALALWPTKPSGS